MKNQIFLKDALKIIHSVDENGIPLPFDVEIREFSKQNKTGGKHKIYNEAKLLTSEKTTPQKKIFSNISFQDSPISKNPNHWENRTRNISLPNGEIKKINILFIIKFNGKKVIY